MGRAVSSRKRELQVIVRPCGSGKTLWAAREAVSELKSRPVIYVAPSRALLHQFLDFVLKINDSVRAVFCVGRRLWENCVRGNVFVYPHFGLSPESFCTVCPEWSSCSYISARSGINSPRPGVLYLTTYSYVVHNVIPSAWSSAVVFYDEMPSAVWMTGMPEMVRNVRRWVRVNRSRKLREEIVRSALLHVPRSFGKRRREIAGRMIPEYAFLPSLPIGEQTYLLTATPVPAVIREIFHEAGEIRIDRSVALDQTVLLNHVFLPHSADWEPPGDGCGFKKNTAHGMPYFRASMGLGSWRGVPLKVLGTDSPPPYVYVLLAALLRASRFLLSDVVCRLDEEFVHPFLNARYGRIETAVLAVELENGDISPAPYEITVSDLIQLLGRSGRLPDGGPGRAVNEVYTSMPLRAKNTHFDLDFVRRLIPGSFDDGTLLRDLAFYAVARNVRDPKNWLAGYYPYAVHMASEFRRLVSVYRERIEHMNDMLADVLPHVHERSSEIQRGGHDHEEEEELPF